MAAATMVFAVLFLVTKHGWASHYIWVIAAAMGLFSTLRFSPSQKINTALVILSFGASVYTGELLLSLAKSSQLDFAATQWLTFPADFTEESTRGRLKKNLNEKPTFDRRSRLEVVDDLRRQGHAAFPGVFPQALLHREASGRLNSAVALSIRGVDILPLGGIPNVLTVFCNESGEYVTYTSDEHGFRNPPGIWNSRRFDVVAVGDSFAQGYCVPWAESFLGIIRTHYANTVTIGMESNGPLIELASLKEYALAYQPRVVLWFYYEGNDLQDLEYERESPFLMQYFRTSFTQGLLVRRGEIEKALKEYVSEARRKRGERVGWEQTIKLHHVREVLSARYYGSNRHSPDKICSTIMSSSSEVTVGVVNMFRHVLIDAAKTVHGGGGQLYFVYLPAWARYGCPGTPNQDRERVLQIVDSLELPLIDLHPVFARQQDALALFPFRRYNHYNTEGHRLVAEEVLRVLKTRVVVSSK